MHTLRDHLAVYGVSTLSLSELFTIALLSPHTALPSPGLQARLARLLKQGDWVRLTQASLADLQDVGFTQHQAERVVAICELSRRLALLEMEPMPQITTLGDAVRLLRPLMLHLPQESFRVLVLNTKNQVVENTELYRGSVLSTQVRIAEILRPALVRHCPAFLVAHQHPSGDPEPSRNDLEMSERLRQAATVLDIELVDHLILGQTRALSLRSHLSW